MDLTHLGHAGWLIEAAGLRLLCDPLLEREHYRGVFEVTPPRRLRAERLRPDFILVSHAHPDHFDVASLAALARLDAQAVVVTPDALVAEAARALGFVTVHEVPSGRQIDLDGVTLITTESLGHDEWGLMVADADGLAWNHVDAVFDGPEHARAVTQAGLAALRRERVDLALVMGRPMHEIAAQTGGGIGFPLREYAKLLRELAAIDPAVIVPASADTAHVEAFAWLNQIVYPVDAERFAADLARVCPPARVLAPTLGGCFRLRDGEVTLDEGGGAALIEALGSAPDRMYRPFAIAELRDPGESVDLDACRAEIARWIHEELRAALLANYPSFGVTQPLRFVVEIVYPDHSRDGYTLTVDGANASVEPGVDPRWDAYNQVAGTLLAEILAGRRSWGEALLSGCLRVASRAYVASEAGLAPANVGPAFLYYGLSYDESFRRSVRWQIEQLSI